MNPNNAPPPAAPMPLSFGGPVTQEQIGKIAGGLGLAMGGMSPEEQKRQALINGLMQQSSAPQYGAANAVGDVLNAWGQQKQANGPAPNPSSWVTTVTPGG